VCSSALVQSPFDEQVYTSRDCFGHPDLGVTEAHQHFCDHSKMFALGLAFTAIPFFDQFVRFPAYASTSPAATLFAYS
jgi:hypothetical protein